MNDTYHAFVAAAGAAEITHIALIDDNDDELDGGSPAYARKAVTWTSPGTGGDDAGQIRPNADIDFDVPASTTVKGWRGFDASTEGTDYGGENFTTPVVFSGQGVLKLKANATYINHVAPV